VKSSEDRKTASTKLKNLIHPILVKKSYLYRGTPPLIKIRSAISIRNLNAVTSAAIEVVFSKNSGRALNNQDVTAFCR
jgi:hypothetical protein